MRKSDRENRKRLQINSNQSMKRSINYKHEKFASFFGVKHSLGNNLFFRWRFRQVNQTSFVKVGMRVKILFVIFPLDFNQLAKCCITPKFGCSNTLSATTQLQVEGSSPRLDVRIRSYDKTRSSYNEAFILSSLIFLHITTRFQFPVETWIDHFQPQLSIV
jgi:hypothetical protein